ncbi:MAG: flavin reductase [Bacteroidota bacterium]
MTEIIFNQDDFPHLDKFFRRNLINCLSGFKSLNLVGTIGQDDRLNLAPFTQIIHVGASPALMGMLVRPDSVPRHTLSNILEREYYTFNHVKETYFKQAHQCSARYDISEFEATGIEPYFGDEHPAPYVKEASLKIGLKLEERLDLKINGTIFIIGSVIEIIVPEECLDPDGFIDIEKAGSLTCSGLDAYHITQRLARLSYAKPDQELNELD